MGILKTFLQKEDAQATTEYILLLTLIVVSTAALARTILKALDKGILRLGGQLEKDLKVGRAPLYVWTN